MDDQKKTEQLLNELRRMTGLAFELPENADADPKVTLERLSALCDSCKQTGSKESVLRRWITGESSEAEFRTSAARLHLRQEGEHLLCLLQTDGPADASVLQVLRQILADRTGSLVIPYTDDQVLLLLSANKKDPEFYRRTAETVLSALNAELFVNAKIALSTPFEGSSGLPAAFRQTGFAMDAGRLFQPEDSIYEFGSLGTGRLLYDQTPEILRDYLAETIGDPALLENSEAFRGDNLLTAECFLNNDLNVAETARQLYIHRNTLLYRLELIRRESGLDIRSFDGAMKYRLCLLASRALNRQA